MAWNISLIILSLTVFNHLERIESWFTFIIPILGILVLFLTKKQFQAKSEFERIEDGVLISSAIFLVSLLYGTLGFIFLGPKLFNTSFSVPESFFNTINVFFFNYNPNLGQISIFADWFLFSLHILGIVTLLLIVLSLFMPVLYVLRILPEERLQAEKILLKYGNSAIDYFKLWPDKSFYFSKDKQCFIAYKVKYSVAICLGDPSGPNDQIESILVDFYNFSRRNGWKVAFHHTKPNFKEIYKKLDYNIIKIGEEGTIDIEKFINITIKESDFKRSMKRFAKISCSISISNPPHPDFLLIELKEISDEWLSTGRRERSFTLGKFSFEYLQKTPVILLRDSSNKILAFLNQIDTFIENEVTIDMMRHRKEIPNGTMDFIFCSYLSLLHKKGVKYFSLGLAPFVGLDVDESSSVMEKLLKEFSEHFDKLFSVKGLRKYKEKFEPFWEDRYFVYRGSYYSFMKIIFAFIRITEK